MTTPNKEQLLALAVAHPNDVCECGDYRHQHENGAGRCKLGGFCTPTPCTSFRLSRAHSLEAK